MLVDVSRAVEYLHLRKVVHGDLKPQNYVMTKDGKALLIDFEPCQNDARATFLQSTVLHGHTPRVIAYAGE